MGYSKAQDLILAAEGPKEGRCALCLCSQESPPLLLGATLSGSRGQGGDGLRFSRQGPVTQCALLPYMFSHPPQFSRHCSGESNWFCCHLHPSEETEAHTLPTECPSFLTTCSQPPAPPLPGGWAAWWQRPCLTPC